MTELATRNGAPGVQGDPMEIGEVLAKSGYFKDATDGAQAAVKIMAGVELGFGPVAAMTGVHIIEGKPSLGANMLAALVRRHPNYDYRIRKLDNEGCEIAFSIDGDDLEPTSTFTIDDARRIQWYDRKNSKWRPLTDKGPWRFYPRNMLFARAMSNGVTFHCPDLLAGAPIYTPDELEDLPRADVEVEIVEEPPPSKPITEERAVRLYELVEQAKIRSHLAAKLRSLDANVIEELSEEQADQLEAWASRK